MTRNLMIYGATGYTGRMAVQAALSRGLRPILAGRHTARLTALAAETGLETRVFGVDAATSHLSDVAVLLNCAGPFAWTAEPLMRAAIAQGTDYLDITAEIGTYLLAEALAPGAEAAGVMLLPGVGWDVVPTDALVARLAAGSGKPHQIRIALEVAGGMSRGSANSASEIMAAGLLERQGGVLRPKADASPRAFDFGAGAVDCLPLSFGDLVTAWHLTGAPDIEMFVHVPGTAFPTGDLSALPDGPTEAERRAHPARALVEVTGEDGCLHRGRIETVNGYDFTPLSAMAAAARVLDGQRRPGFATPAQVFGPGFAETIPGTTMILERTPMTISDPAQRVTYDRLGGPEVLQLVPFDLPEPRAGEVQLRILAIGMNRFDALMRRDHYVIPPVLPSAMGNEAVGEVTAVGAGVTHVRPGDRVAVLPLVSPILGTGTYATHATVPAFAAQPAMADLTPVEEAGLWMAALQAWNMVARHDLPPGAWLLITAATSAVGRAALQIARDLGLRAIATTRRDSEVESLRLGGAAEVIVTRAPGDITAAIDTMTGGAGVALVIEAVGGAILAECVAATAEGAHIIAYGAQSSPDFKTARIDLPLFALDRRSLTFAELFEVTDNPARFAEAQEYIRDAVRRGALRPVIDRSFALQDVQAAQHWLETGAIAGKVILCP